MPRPKRRASSRNFKRCPTTNHSLRLKGRRSTTATASRMTAEWPRGKVLKLTVSWQYREGRCWAGLKRFDDPRRSTDAGTVHPEASEVIESSEASRGTECQQVQADPCSNARTLSVPFEVGETGFEGKGQRFPFRQADGREFCWKDGTVQRVEKIQKTLFQVR